MKLSDKYHKIMSLYKRDSGGRFMFGDYSTDEIKYLKDNDWVFTEKVDGTNIRVSYSFGEATYAGRSDEAQIPVPLIYALDNHFKTMQGRQRLENVFGTMDTVTLYGEGYGKKIQKSGALYNPDGVDFVLFDVKINDIYLERHNVDDIAKKLELVSVPIIGHGTLNDAEEMVKKGIKSKWGDFNAEGIVARPREELLTRKGERVITKIKVKDYS